MASLTFVGISLFMSLFLLSFFLAILYEVRYRRLVVGGGYPGGYLGRPSGSCRWRLVVGCSMERRHACLPQLLP